MNGKNGSWKGIIILIIAVILLFSFCDNDGGSSDGGRCKFCGNETNWTYKGGGYVCYSCDKKYYK